MPAYTISNPTKKQMARQGIYGELVSEIDERPGQISTKWTGMASLAIVAHHVAKPLTA